MAVSPLVSVIIPCYNGENFVFRLLKSVLEQEYTNIEVIFINDGSSDKTEEIASQYMKKMKKRGMQCQYIYQENKGVCGAINTGLKLFHGEYIMYPNSDDWLTIDCIKKMVEYMETHKDKGTVISKGAVVSEKDTTKIIGILGRKNTSNGWLFRDLIFGRDIYFGSAGWMTRAEMFLKVIPERYIYECRHGQNWQLYLPLLYKYEAGFLEEILWYYQVRDQSIEHQVKDFSQQIDRTYQYESILQHVLNGIEMPGVERQEYLNKIKLHYIHIRLRLAVQYQNFQAAEVEYAHLKEKDCIAIKDRIYYLCGKYPFLFKTCKSLKFPVNTLRKFAKQISVAACCRKNGIYAS